MNQPRAYTSKNIREIERIQIHERGTPGYTLMQRAGEAAFSRCRAHLTPGGHALVLAGPGNNGGDGYVVARLLREAGYGVTLVSLSDPAKLNGDARKAKDDFLPHGDIQRFSGDLPEADLVVDALLGTGLERPLSAEYLVAVQLINAQSSPVLAIDIPSGLNSDSGEVMGSAVLATESVTFIGIKQGMLRKQGPRYCGHITLDDLNVDADLLLSALGLAALDSSHIANILTPRPIDCHKGTFGHAMLVGGNGGFGGAIRMSAEAAARCGAGLVTVFTHPDHAALISAQRPELMTRPVANIDLEILQPLKRSSCIGFGPGLGSDDWSEALFDHVMSLDRPMVVDADALNWLAGKPRQGSQWVLTPHPGEAARLLDCSTAEVQADRESAVKALQHRYGGIVVLKGAGTLICNGQQTWFNIGGNPGMATGGMGDVLTGIITGLMAQLGDPLKATLCGVAVHTAAADLAAANSPRGLLAMDVVEQLRGVVNPQPAATSTLDDTRRV